jgi:hypothetical protein
MQLDPGFRAVFACWLHVFSASEFWISVHEKSSLLAAEFRKSADRSISSSISSKPEWILGSSSQNFAKHDLNRNEHNVCKARAVSIDCMKISRLYRGNAHRLYENEMRRVDSADHGQD